MRKNLCLFAGYDKNGLVDDYVLHSISSFSKFCDVYYCADCEMKPESLDRLKPFVKKSFAHRHKKYDFGSWSELIKHIGWETIEKYENLILVNDSVYGPFYDIQKVVKNFSNSNYDFYGFTPNPKRLTYHIQSYFFIFKHNIITDKIFQNFFDNIISVQNKVEIIKKYEKGLSYLLYKNGYKSDTFIKKADCYYPNKIIKQTQTRSTKYALYIFCPLSRAYDTE